jgi:hypothetical protein
VDILFVTQVDLTKVVDTVSDFFGSIFDKLVTVDTLQVIKLVKTVNIIQVIELDKIVRVRSILLGLIGLLEYTYFMELNQR